MSDDTITITGSDGAGTNGYGGAGSFVINLNDTYGATTSYMSTDSSLSYTIGSGTIDTISITNFDWATPTEDTHIKIDEIEKMCAEYPALDKVYENFKTVYDLVKQDWKGKLDAENNS